jgi:DNA modification methylase
MKRTSESREIINPEKYKLLAPRYLNLLNELTTKNKVITDESFSDLVNFKSNKDIPRHNWFEYKQGYGEDLVVRIIEKEKPNKSSYILDPFAGVGTTNLVAQTLGFKSIGFDINPVAALAARVKTIFFKSDQIKLIQDSIKKFNPKKISHNIPQSPLLEKSFDPNTFNQLMLIKGFYENVSDESVRDFFKLAYLSIIEDCSNRIKDGNGLKIVKNKKIINDVFEYYLQKCKQMEEDLNHINRENESIIISGSMINSAMYNQIKNKKVGLVVFSPPYANCFDYCEVYKLEFWMGDFVKDYDDFKEYRSNALRSHVNSKFDHNILNKNKDVELIAEVISCFNIWNKNIPDMVKGYFDDMTEIFKKLYELMLPNSKCYIVVANSGYRGILVPTDLLLANIAEKNGFKTLKIGVARKIRASSQQMEELHNQYDKLMRESIIVLERK